MFFAISSLTFSQKILIPMDLSQTDHLKAYGVTFHILKKGGTAEWLLNYRGGSFFADYNADIAMECRIKGVSFEEISGSQAASIYAEVQSENNNMDVIKLEKAPKIALTPTTNGIAEATSAPKTKASSKKVNGIAIDSASSKSFSILWLIAQVITPDPDA